MFNKDKCFSEMQVSIKAFSNELKNIRTGRVSPDILNSLFIDNYGSKTPLTQLSNVNNLDNMTLSVNVWDASLIKIIEKTIIESNLGVTPQSDGTLILLKFPELTAERRKELVKMISEVSGRKFLDELKKFEKEKTISLDEIKKFQENIQKLTDNSITEIENLAQSKESEILKV